MRSRAAALFLLALGAAFPAAGAMRSVDTTHFRVYYEDAYPPAGVGPVLEGLHAKVLLDLLPFAPWAGRERIEVYVFRTPESYHAVTGMPAWAGGHVNPRQRRIYTYQGEHFQRTMAHELGHLLFEDFFVTKGASPPVWLNEGVATLMEWEYGLGQEQGALRDKILKESALPLASFLAFDYRHQPRANADVNLWYTQASSVAAFLMRRFTRDQFFRFCIGVRENMPVGQALATSYGLMIPDVAALERLWRASLE